MVLSRQERIRIILEQLSAAETPQSVESAIRLLEEVADAVEDEHSGADYEENPGLEYRGRMYAPKPDFIMDARAGKVGRTRGHYIYFWGDGSFDLVTLGGRVVAFNHHPRS